MGGVGIALAMIGVVVCPITSGDTAFRSARLVLADWFKIDQKKWQNRLMLCVPVLGVGAILGIGNALGKIDYTIIWRYFSWTNQTLAMIVLWAASMYLFKEKKNYWITAVPATFMSAVSVTYFLLGNECLGQFLNTKTADGATVYNTAVAYPVGIIAAALFLGIFLGLLFLMATVLIIYYKQVSEGYDDRGRFRIMQQVGMTPKEVKATIRTQVLLMFFLPLVTAAIHIAFAFPLIKQIVFAFGLQNVHLFLLCTLGTFGVFALLYTFVYLLTARTYYRIVRMTD